MRDTRTVIGASGIHAAHCTCPNCDPAPGLSRCGHLMAIALGLALGAACDAAGMPDPFVVFGL